ncbi:MAG TPA: hypothetical protein VFS20_07590 [Longimicrobium sp.]|nr:hypothetical protein [Longimicrobium sp.]
MQGLLTLNLDDLTVNSFTTDEQALPIAYADSATVDGECADTVAFEGIPSKKQQNPG